LDARCRGIEQLARPRDVGGAISGLGLGFFTPQSYPVAVPVPDQQQQSQDQPAEQQQQSDDPLAAAGTTREQQRATIRAAAVAYCNRYPDDELCVPDISPPASPAIRSNPYFHHSGQ
jgi:hypothetical protein